MVPENPVNCAPEGVLYSRKYHVAALTAVRCEAARARNASAIMAFEERWDFVGRTGSCGKDEVRGRPTAWLERLGNRI